MSRFLNLNSTTAMYPFLTKTRNGGWLGSHIDEEHSKLWNVLRTAELVIHRIFERMLRPRLVRDLGIPIWVSSQSHHNTQNNLEVSGIDVWCKQFGDGFYFHFCEEKLHELGSKCSIEFLESNNFDCQTLASPERILTFSLDWCSHNFHRITEPIWTYTQTLVSITEYFAFRRLARTFDRLWFLENWRRVLKNILCFSKTSSNFR